MNQQERDMVEGLFQRLQQAESQTGPRDPEAEVLIHHLMARQPAAPYLLAQVVLAQEQGLRNLQARVEELEQERAERSQGGGFLGGLFGGGLPQSATPVVSRAATGTGRSNSRFPVQGANGDQAAAQGSGFMAGAMQTAMGVAGGVLLGNVLAGLFGGEAKAAETPAAIPEVPMAPEEDASGGLFDGLFGGGDDEEF